MKRSIWFSFFLSILTVFLLTGCDTRRDDNTVDDRTVITDDDNATRDNTDIGTDTEADKDWMIFEDNRDYAYNERDAFKSDIEGAMDRLDENINMIEEKVDDFTGDKEDDYDARIKDIKLRRDNIEKRMDAFENTKDNNWNEFKSNIRTAWMDIKKDVIALSTEVGVDNRQPVNNDNKTY